MYCFGFRQFGYFVVVVILTGAMNGLDKHLITK